MKVKLQVVPDGPGPIWHGIIAVQVEIGMIPVPMSTQKLLAKGIRNPIRSYQAYRRIMPADHPVGFSGEFDHPAYRATGWGEVVEEEWEPSALVRALADAAWDDEEEEAEAHAIHYLVAKGYSVKT